MHWLKSHWQWAALNLSAIYVLVVVWSQGSRDWVSTDTFHTGLESGKWAIRFLLFCLAMTPLSTIFGWRGAIKLRKSAGLWSFGFALVHVGLYISEVQFDWLVWRMRLYIALGLLGLLILAALAVTSNRWAMRRLKKGWKRLHRLVYVAGGSVVAHAILATSASKKVLVFDPQAVQELRVYLGVLTVLLVVRVPVVRRLLARIPSWLRQRRWADPQMTPVTIPNSVPEHQPQVIEREVELPLEVPFEDLLTEVQPEEEVERVPVP